MEIILEIVLEILIAPIFELLEEFGQGKKHQTAIQVTLAILLFLTMFSIIMGVAFIVSGDKFLLPGIIITTISSVILIVYLVYSIIIKIKPR